jgi:hypothetical protein
MLSADDPNEPEATISERVGGAAAGWWYTVAIALVGIGRRVIVSALELSRWLEASSARALE